MIKQRNQLTLTNENRQQVKKNREMLPTVVDLQQQKVGWLVFNGTFTTKRLYRAMQKVKVRYRD